jgi:high-affinity nickel permease
MTDDRRGGGGLGAGFVLLIFVGVIVKFWVWILAAFAAVALIVLVFVLVHRSDKRHAAELEHIAAIARRAEQQHAQILAGDERGIYGAFPPADLAWRA